MALVILGGGVTDMRGSIGGTTFSRNMGGNYARARTKPINQRSFRQTEKRSWISQLGRNWWDDLSAAQRLSWITYAEQTTWTNRLGQTISISGMSAFVRTNMIGFQADRALIETGPPSGGHAGAPEFGVLAWPTTQQLIISFIGAPWDTNHDDDRVCFYMGLPSSPGRKAQPKTFRYAGTIPGVDPAGQTFPFNLTPQWTFGAGQIITLGMRRVDPDGRVCARMTGQCTATDP